MVLAAGRGGDDRVDELAALLRQDLAEALFLGIELFVEGGLGHARAGDDVIDRGFVITAGREDRQRGLGEAGPPPPTRRLAGVACAGGGGPPRRGRAPRGPPPAPAAARGP